MRKYEKKETGTLTELYCNRCGKKLHVENGIAMEGVLPVDIAWGYFSQKDTQRHQFDLCEDCYDEIIRGFAIPVTEKIEKDLL